MGPDLVLGISRGGLLVAGGLAYALGVKNTATISVEFYTGVDERLELPMLLPRCRTSWISAPPGC